MSKDVLTDVLVHRRQWMDAPWTSYLVQHALLCRVQDLDVGAAVLAHSLGVMTRQEELVAWHGLQDRHLSHAGDGQ
jgi:hypothetical protein